MINVISKTHQTYDGTYSVDLFIFVCDEASELPDDVTYFSTPSNPCKMAQGSMGYAIASGELYMLKSDGDWALQD